ncbi:type II toxin-antitoxin system RelE/ParE family toxin [Streptomyces sp. NPDC001262]|uniref:type II toxin-antitoxin system RelE family toxin n=1 Tax=unclassified Streptomyces TaxID=2593676 RepID=UPI0036863653
MRYTVIWEPAASSALRRLRARDPEAVKPLVRAVNGLALDPEPAASAKLGGGLRRLHVGNYRATYRIDGDRIAVEVILVGKVPS